MIERAALEARKRAILAELAKAERFVQNARGALALLDDLLTELDKPVPGGDGTSPG